MVVNADVRAFPFSAGCLHRLELSTVIHSSERQTVMRKIVTEDLETTPDEDRVARLAEIGRLRLVIEHGNPNRYQLLDPRRRPSGTRVDGYRETFSLVEIEKLLRGYSWRKRPGTL